MNTTDTQNGVSAAIVDVIARSSGGTTPAEEAFARTIADLCQGPWAEPTMAGRVRFLAGYLREAADNLDAARIPTPAELVDAYLDADHAVSEHMQTCPDQREVAHCRTCQELNDARWRARQGMEANVDAIALRNSPAIIERQRQWARDYLERYSDNHGDDD